MLCGSGKSGNKAVQNKNDAIERELKKEKKNCRV